MTPVLFNYSNYKQIIIKKLKNSKIKTSRKYKHRKNNKKNYNKYKNNLILKLRI